MSADFELEAPDHFTAGAVGPPGQRVFYLQAREGSRVVTLKCEKEHVRALGEYLDGLLRKARPRVEPAADAGLLEPLAPAWDVGSIGVGHDEAAARVVIEAHEADLDDEDDEDDEEEEEEEEEEAGAAADAEADDEPATARFRITLGQAAAFVERARALVQAGRPICPLCQRPKDPTGHRCPRSNGHAVTET